MRFSIYSEIQQHPGQTPEQLYAEVLEQVVNADRLGYDAYAVVEHFFFPKFSISANPTAFFAAAAQRTKNIHFRTMLHALPYHNPLVLASAIAATDILTGGRYEFGVGRGHGWIPAKAGVPLDEHARPRYEEAARGLGRGPLDCAHRNAPRLRGEHADGRSCSHLVLIALLILLSVNSFGDLSPRNEEGATPKKPDKWDG